MERSSNYIGAVNRVTPVVHNNNIIVGVYADLE
jgi:hypothetical protein